jgi:DHA1 family bicyclomycin/chloramphenicol resistance-like MFS transporter
MQYSICFSINAVGFIGASQFAATLGARFGMARTVMAAVSFYAAFALILFAVAAAGIDRLPILLVLLFCAFGCLGLVIPTTMVLALEDHGPLAGLASALGGTLQMAAGGVTIALTSLVFNGTPGPMVAAIALCAIGAFVLATATLGWRERAPQAAE